MLATYPSIAPPNGITPNFVNPYTRGPEQIEVTSVILGLVIIFFINRCYVKLWLMKKVSWDDATLLVAMVSIHTHKGSVHADFSRSSVA